MADLRAGRRVDEGVLARRLAPIRFDTDEAALGPVRDLATDAIGAGEVAFLAAALLDRPSQPGLYRGCSLVDVVSVKAETCLEPQRIPGAKTNRLDPRVFQEKAPDAFSFSDRDG